MASQQDIEESTWPTVRMQLIQHAVPDSRFHYDFSQFVPNFRGSSAAIDRLLSLNCYQSAQTLLVTPDNSLQDLRYRALKAGKKLLVATHKMKRGFVLLDPGRIGEDRLELASHVDGMEVPGIGISMTITSIEDQIPAIDMFVTGARAVGDNGQLLLPTVSHPEIQYAICLDREVMRKDVPIAAIVHDVQITVIDHKIEQSSGPNLRVDYIATPERLLEFPKQKDHQTAFEIFTQDLLDNVPPLQELKGIKIMENIMQGSGFTQAERQPEPEVPSETRANGDGYGRKDHERLSSLEVGSVASVSLKMFTKKNIE